MAEDTFFADYRRVIEKRIRERIARVRALDPNADTRRIIELQIAQEVANLKKFGEDESNDFSPKTTQILIQWVEQLGRKKM